MHRLRLPYANFAVTAMVLHDWDLRINLEACNWLSAAIRGVLSGYRQHPDVLAWRQHHDSVLVLHDCCLRQLYWRDTKSKFTLRLGETTPSLPGYSVPEHIGQFRFHALERAWLRSSARAEWYEQWGWTDEPGRV